MSTSKFRIKKVCNWCGKEFLSQKTTTRYCSKRCAEHAYKDRVRRHRISEAEAKVRVHSKDKSIQKIRDNPYLRLKETAQLLDVSVRTVYNLIYTGKLKAAKLSPWYLLCLRFRRQTPVNQYKVVNTSPLVCSGIKAIRK